MAPYALAIFFGLLVSAALYFTLAWPQVEPEDPPADPDPVPVPPAE